LVCLGLGIGAGLAVSWWVWPVEYVDVAPDSLRPLHRQEYLLLIGQAYSYEQDLEAAKARMAGLGNTDTIASEVAALAEQYAQEGRQTADVRVLAELAYALGRPRAALAAYLPYQTPLVTWTPRPTATPAAAPTDTATPPPTPTETATVTPTATETATSTATPTGTPGTPQAPSTPAESPATSTPSPAPRFRLIQQERVCVEPGGRLMVWAYDGEGEPMPNVELLLRWTQGEERFYTGLKPDIGVGYADADLQETQVYQVSVIGIESDVALGITADPCAEQGLPASWEVTFQLDASLVDERETRSR
jgi:hypothetical protein